MGETEDIGDEIQRAIQDICGHHGEMVTSWVVLAGVIDGQGKRALYTLSDQHARAWDVLGMLMYAISEEQAAVFKRATQEDS